VFGGVDYKKENSLIVEKWQGIFLFFFIFIFNPLTAIQEACQASDRAIQESCQARDCAIQFSCQLSASVKC
jgi:hypothetical protein